jgi:hypothetical protein
MEELITVHGGILGTRKLSSAYADLILRRLGCIKGGQAIEPRYVAWSQLVRRPWRPDEIKQAKKLKADGVRVPVIAAAIGRSKGAVYLKLRAA